MYAVSLGILLAWGAAAEVGVAVCGVGGALSPKADRGVDCREAERRSRLLFLLPFFEAVGAILTLGASGRGGQIGFYYSVRHCIRILWRTFGGQEFRNGSQIALQRSAT